MLGQLMSTVRLFGYPLLYVGHWVGASLSVQYVLTPFKSRLQSREACTTILLPPPRRICFRRCLSVCLLATLRQNFRTDLHEVFRKGWQWTSEQITKISVAIRINVWIQGLFSGFVAIGRYGKWLTDINLLLILIRQMAALVKHALEEVCTAPVLLVC